MSRSFERKVEKNRQKYNITQQKKGVKPGASLGSKGEGLTFKGRNLLLPGFLFFLGALYGAMGLASGDQNMNTTLYIVTVALYFVLGVVLFLRKPYLRIYKNKLFTSKFNRDRSMEASTISKIVWSGKSITIISRTKEPNWTFSRTRNLFDTEAMGASLRDFAATYGIVLEKK